MAATSERADNGRLRQLVLVFCAWKVLLLLLAAYCPGPGYDTSALISLDNGNNRHDHFDTSPRYYRLALNLFRWDALYFVKGAERAKVHEQEWAFSWAYSRGFSVLGQYISGGTACSSQCYVWAGIAVSNVCHLLSVLVLYRLLSVIVGKPQQRRHTAFVASVLHVLTPASLFLSSPYAEGLFSLLNFTGMLCYAQSRATSQVGSPTLYEDFLKLSSGLFFASATLMRSNGLLSGLILMYDVARYIPRIISMQVNLHDMRRVFVTCVSGMFVALGFIGPQYLAYLEFCSQGIGSTTRPWCARSVPSIYSWVQSYYWDVGLFRYWTLSNLPLFLLAVPMLWLLVASSVTALRDCFRQPLHGHSVPQTTVTRDPDGTSSTYNLPELALPQLVLAVAAATSFHVQVINRIASGYPIWYVTVATWLLNEQSAHDEKKTRRQGQWAVRGMIMYAMIQGMLFANFLPPA
ncbi:glycosyltransferase family 76 protein [Dothidotthia symphoricarpi CBS 119687]|uniref:GPI mannosyltransferase 2 n=1 Tax=Dothidotthia symphoricarpi CBS 119687 TaxID=1392245 RepID=A0A6A6AGL5_9PLEO|nr:glycosyltransferase family 76 protein [Dothidotthia symphoricarpi CBS 119687]KAF2130383.1 glycosyltransferase family 76 protein [Dothidotthia symphoricarpi CBS 119687]